MIPTLAKYDYDIAAPTLQNGGLKVLEDVSDGPKPSSYGNNNPVNYVDPDGLNPKTPPWARENVPRFTVVPKSFFFGWGQNTYCKELKRLCELAIESINANNTYGVNDCRRHVARNNCAHLKAQCDAGTLDPGLYNIFLSRRHPEYKWPLPDLTDGTQLKTGDVYPRPPVLKWSDFQYYR